jgi:PEP-CTERM motif
MGKRLPFLSGLVLLACLAPRTVSADTIPIAFDVTVTFAHGNLEPIFGLPIAVGNVFGGSFALDPSSPDHNGARHFGFYSGEGELQLDAGRGLSLPIVSYAVYDNAACGNGSCDAFHTSSYTTTLPGYAFVSAALAFQTPPDRRNSDALPVSAAEIASAYSSTQLFFRAVVPEGDITFGGVVRIHATDPHPVPEPATWLLMGTALAAMTARRARRSSLRRRTPRGRRRSPCQTRG